jgi:murein DD-endopeptidase MepM/ murein hydrolase activator NlpD
VPGECLQQQDGYPVGWQNPYYGKDSIVVTSRYGAPREGYQHEGVDFASTAGGGFSVLAASEGEVSRMGPDGTIGYFQYQRRRVDEEGNPLAGESNVIGDKEDVWTAARRSSIVDEEGNFRYGEMDDGTRFIWEETTPAGRSTTPGELVVVDHGHGLRSIYRHTKPAESLTVGQHVYGGQHIGTAANIGKSWGTHLHFEMRVHKTLVNPCSYIGCQ